MYPMRIQSDHSGSDRSVSQETLASVPITEKSPFARGFFFGRFISLHYSASFDDKDSISLFSRKSKVF